jgi:hypothetical protein
MVLEQPVAVKAVGSSDTKMIALDGDKAARTEPGIHHGSRQMLTGGLQDARPKTF